MSPLLKIIIVLIVGGGIYAFAASPLFDVKSYEVTGNSYYTADEIIIMGNCKIGGNIFWGSACGDIKGRLEKDAYIESVKIKRLLPDKISIEIQEKQQSAAVVYGDNYVVIDQDGIVLRKTNVEPQVTLIHGLTVSKIKVGEKIEAEQKVLLRQSLEILQLMTSSDMYFKMLDISEDGVKAYVLDYLVCTGTQTNIMQTLESGNLAKVVRGLFDSNIERGTIKVSGDDYISFSPAFE
jgi:cell division protein FtsQ